MRRKSARKPLLDFLITSPGQPAHLLSAVVVTVDATTHLGDVFTGKSTRIQLMKKQCTLAFLSSQDAEYDRLKSTRASARDAKSKTATVSTPTTRTETVALFSFMFFEKESPLLLGKLSKSTHINSLKPASLEPISEIISDLCSVVSFIVLDLIFDFTTNIRTLELTRFSRTVSILHTFENNITLLRTPVSIDKTKASVSKLSFDTDANYFVLFSKQNLPQVISALEKTKV